MARAYDPCGGNLLLTKEPSQIIVDSPEHVTDLRLEAKLLIGWNPLQYFLVHMRVVVKAPGKSTQKWWRHECSDVELKLFLVLINSESQGLGLMCNTTVGEGVTVNGGDINRLG